MLESNFFGIEGCPCCNARNQAQLRPANSAARGFAVRLSEPARPQRVRHRRRQRHRRRHRRGVLRSRARASPSSTSPSEASAALAEPAAARGHARRGGASATCATSPRCRRAIAEAAAALGDFCGAREQRRERRPPHARVGDAGVLRRPHGHQRAAGLLRDPVRRAGHEAAGRRLHRQPRLHRLAGQGQRATRATRSPSRRSTASRAAWPEPLGKDRIRVNTVSPGWVMTERQMSCG